MAEMVRNYLVIGAHPDDPDLLFGGCAVKLLKAGHQVKFVSVSSGDCGHYAMEPAALALRRHREAQESAKVAGLTGYEILDVPDCHVVCTLELRERLIRVIRDFEPDVVISHRLCDYHADHRATAQCVMDCAYLVRVPMYCADTPIPRKDPVFAYGYDAFTDPRPIRADADARLPPFPVLRVAAVEHGAGSAGAGPHEPAGTAGVSRPPLGRPRPAGRGICP